MTREDEPGLGLELLVKRGASARFDGHQRRGAAAYKRTCCRRYCGRNKPGKRGEPRFAFDADKPAAVSREAERMKCLVEIEMDGDAFQPIARLELARILEDLARRVRYIGGRFAGQNRQGHRRTAKRCSALPFCAGRWLA